MGSIPTRLSKGNMKKLYVICYFISKTRLIWGTKFLGWYENHCDSFKFQFIYFVFQVDLLSTYLAHTLRSKFIFLRRTWRYFDQKQRNVLIIRRRTFISSEIYCTPI